PALFASSATLVAWTITLDGTGRNCGAVKTPPGEIVPTVVLPPGIPSTLQVTAGFAVPATLAVIAMAFPNSTASVLGETVTDTDDAEGCEGAAEIGSAVPLQPADAAQNASIEKTKKLPAMLRATRPPRASRCEMFPNIAAGKCNAIATRK